MFDTWDVNQLFTTDESWRGDNRAPSDDFWCLTLDGAWDDDLHESDDDPDAWKEEA
jgi:hypothetical protein